MIDPEELISEFGSGCRRVILSPSGEIVDAFPARAAFLTRDAILRLQDPEGERAVRARPGEIFATWTDGEGNTKGVRALPERDAGLMIYAKGKAIPFTGSAMIEAPGKIRAAGMESDPDAARILRGVEDAMESILMDVLRAGSDEMVGAACLYAWRRSDGRIPDMDISRAELGRSAVARILRARISLIDPDHPSAPGEPPRLPGRADPGLSSAMPVSVLKRILSCDRDEIICHRVSLSDMSDARSRLGRPLTGVWADSVRNALSAHLALPGDAGRAEILSGNGSDHLVLPRGGEEGVISLLSWSENHRLPVVPTGGRDVVAIAPEEVPSPEDIATLRSSLSTLLASRTPQTVPG